MDDEFGLTDEEEEPIFKEMFAADIPRMDLVKRPASGMLFTIMKSNDPQDPLSIALMKRPPQHPSLVAKAAKAAKPKEPQMANLNEAPIAAPPETPVTKADGDVADLDAGEILVGNPATSATSTPASPGWEQMDADTAQKWTTILTRADIALETLSDREAQEAVSPEGNDTDFDNSYDLASAREAVQWVIGILAAYAVGEQTEADEVSDGVFKALQSLDPVKVGADADVILGLRAVKKAGRVLSGSNEQAIRDAIASLTNVLATLPAAPVEDAVVKAQEVPTLPQTPNEPLIAAYDLSHAPIGVTVASKMLSFDQAKERVTKAKGDPMVACYNANGDLIGVVDPDDLVTTAAGKPAETADAAPAPADGDGAQPPNPDVADAAAANAATAAAAPTAPVAPVAKALDNMAETVRKAVADAIEAAEEGHQKVVKSLEDRLAKVETSPAPGGPLLSDRPHGGPESGAHLRDQGAGSNPALELVEKQLAVATDPSERTRLQRLAFLETLKPRYQ
jgi:hypothetical protein